MKVANILVGYATMKLLQREILLNIKGEYMKESNILVGNAACNSRTREILLNTKGQYMKESNSLAANATIKQVQRPFLLNTKGQYMKESSTLANIVASNTLVGQISDGTKEKCIFLVIVQLEIKLKKYFR